MYLSKFYDSVLQPTAMLVAVSMSIVCITVLCHYFLVIAIARDKKGRVHYMEIQLDKSYPKSPPSISVVGIILFLYLSIFPLQFLCLLNPFLRMCHVYLI